MLFVFSIMHGSCTGTMGPKIISAVDIVAFGDYPYLLTSAMNQGSFGWQVSEPVMSNLS